MTSPDCINGGFEFIGSAFTWMNASQVAKDRGHAGIYVPAIVFFMSWGLWNLFYYPHLGQLFSFLGGASLVLANIAWVTLLIKYGKRKLQETSQLPS